MDADFDKLFFRELDRCSRSFLLPVHTSEEEGLQALVVDGDRNSSSSTSGTLPSSKERPSRCFRRRESTDSHDDAAAASDVPPLGVAIKAREVQVFSVTQHHGCVPRGSALWMLAHDCPCRVFVFNIVQHPAFDHVILAVIVLGAVLLAWETPLWDPQGSTTVAVAIATDIINGIFIAEMVAKIVALGFVLHEGAYLRSAWNVLDFVIVVVSIVLMAPVAGNGSLSGLRALRVLRALRPLRSINRAPRLKLVILAMAASIWPMFQTLVMISVFFVIFSTLAVTYFQGAMHRCAFDAGEFDWPISADQYDLLLCNNSPNASADGSGFAELCTEWSDLPPEVQQSWAVKQEDQHFAAWTNFLAWQNGSVPNMTDYARQVMDSCVNCSSSYFEELNVSEYVTARNDAGFFNFMQGPVTSRMVCEWLGYQWVLQLDQSFDHIFVSLGSLFELSTTEGWVDVTFKAGDGRGVDMEPVPEANPSAYLFFTVFILVCTFFAMNLFVGVICDTFATKRGEGDGSSVFVTGEQKQWQAVQKMAIKLKPLLAMIAPPASEPFRRWAFAIVESGWFELCAMAVTVLTTLLLCLSYRGQPAVYSLALDITDFVLFGLFALEVVLKLVGYGVQYFSVAAGYADAKTACGSLVFKYADWWNIFDLFVLIGSAVAVAATAVLSVENQAAGVIRSFRLLRVFRLLRGIRGLRALMDTILTAMPGVANVFVVLLFFVTIFSIVGIQLFATVGYAVALTDTANFRSFFVALLTLLRGSTGENWNGIMHDLGRAREGCISDPVFNASVCGFCEFAPQLDEGGWRGHQCLGCEPLAGCGTPAAAYVFWYFFTLVVTLTLLNVCIAVALEAWEQAQLTEEAALKEDALMAFSAAWQRYDPTGRQYIRLEKLPKLLQVGERHTQLRRDDDGLSVRAALFRRTSIESGAHDFSCA